MQIVINERSISSYSDLTRILESLVRHEFGNKLKLVAAYPTESEESKIDVPIVTYEIRRKEPGMFQSRREIKPRHRGTIILDKVVPEIGKDDEVIIGFKDKDGNPIVLEGGTAELQGQMFDYYISFEVWADNNKLVDQWAEEFEKFLFKYTGYIKARGVSEMLYQFREKGSQENKWRSDLKSTTIEYLFRIDEVIGIRIAEVENVLMDVDIVESSEQIVLNLLADYVGSSNADYNKDIISHEVTINK